MGPGTLSPPFGGVAKLSKCSGARGPAGPLSVRPGAWPPEGPLRTPLHPKNTGSRPSVRSLRETPGGQQRFCAGSFVGP